MTDEKVKKEWLSEAGASVADFPQEKRFTSILGRSTGNSGVRCYEVYFMIPETEAEFNERYGTDGLKSIFELAVSAIAVRPTFGKVFTELGYDLDSDGHAKLQALADEYKVGQRKTGVVSAAKAELAANKRVLDKFQVTDLGELEARLARLEELEKAEAAKAAKKASK